MVWAKIDDEILDNEKIMRAGVLGFALHVAAITWSCRKLTDGFIPDARVRLLLDLSELDAEYLNATGSPAGFHDRFLDGCFNVGPVQAARIAERLVGTGLWRRDDERGGYWLHDFLEYNPSRAEAEALARMRVEAGKRGAERRWARETNRDSVPRTMANPIASPMAQPIGDPIADGQHDLWQNDSKAIAKLCPDPDPDPVKREEGDRARASAPPSPPDEEPSETRPSRLAYRDAFCRGIATAKQSPYAWPGAKWDDENLGLVIATFAKSRSTGKALRGEMLLGWIAAAAEDFAVHVLTSGDDPKFWSNFAPKGLLKFLNQESRAEEARDVG